MQGCNASCGLHASGCSSHYRQCVIVQPPLGWGRMHLLRADHCMSVHGGWWQDPCLVFTSQLPISAAHRPVAMQVSDAAGNRLCSGAGLEPAKSVLHAQGGMVCAACGIRAAHRHGAWRALAQGHRCSRPLHRQPLCHLPGAGVRKGQAEHQDAHIAAGWRHATPGQTRFVCL